MNPLKCSFYGWLLAFRSLSGRTRSPLALAYLAGAAFIPAATYAQTAPSVTAGPPTLIVDTGDNYFYNPDAAWPAIPSRDGTTNLAFWAPGIPTKYTGLNLDTMTQYGPGRAPVTDAPGVGTDYDTDGTWMLTVIRAADGVLIGFNHTEDHKFSDHGTGAWNSSGIWTSKDDGTTWTNQGEIIGSPKPAAAAFGGLNCAEMIWSTPLNGWIAYAYQGKVFKSTDPHALPGSWYGYYNGSFSQHIDPTQPAPSLTTAPGLPSSGSTIVTWGSLSWNTYLNNYLLIWWGNNTVYMALSSDALHWGPTATLFVDSVSGESLSYANLIGQQRVNGQNILSSSVTGQDCLLTYGASPATGRRQKDLKENWIHFGALATPQAPDGILASGQFSYDTAVTVSWNGVPMAQSYKVYRSVGSGSWTQIGTVESSSAAPSYIDRTAASGTTYNYRVAAANTVGTSSYSATASAAPVTKYFQLQCVGNGLVIDGSTVTTVGGDPLQEAPAAGNTGQNWKFTTTDGIWYEITNQLNGWALDDTGFSTSPGAKVDLYTAYGNTNQLWSLNRVGPDFIVTNKNANLNLDNYGGATAPGGIVDLFSNPSSSNEKWQILGSPTPPVSIQASGAPGVDSAVTVSWNAGAQAAVYDVYRRVGSGSWSHLASITPADGTPCYVDRAVSVGTTYSYRVTAGNSAGVSDYSAPVSAAPVVKYFQLQCVLNGLVLDGTAVTSPGGLPLQQNPSTGAGQLWRFTTSDNGAHYEIINKLNGYAIDDPGFNKTPGTKLDLWTAYANANQVWTLNPVGSAWTLVNKNANLYLDDYGAAISPGGPVDIYNVTGGAGQLWLINGPQ